VPEHTAAKPVPADNNAPQVEAKSDGPVSADAGVKPAGERPGNRINNLDVLAPVVRTRPLQAVIKQKKVKPINGFFGGDDDDDDNDNDNDNVDDKAPPLPNGQTLGSETLPAATETAPIESDDDAMDIDDDDFSSAAQTGGAAEAQPVVEAKPAVETKPATEAKPAVEVKPTVEASRPEQPAKDEIQAATADGSLNKAEEEEDDPLDAFMADINEQVAQKDEADREVAEKKEKEIWMNSDEEEGGGVRKAASDEEDDFVVEEEEEEEESWLTKIRKKRLVYEKINHSQMNYVEFKKNFYIESAELSRMTPEEVLALRRELGGIRIKGKNCPRPVKTWGQCGLPSKILELIRKLSYEKPTPIQAQAIPCIMSGRNVIGVAKTGSGKTLSYLLPLLRHVAAQPPVSAGDGPIGLIIAPTRELAMQIYGEARRFSKVMDLRCACAYGGSGVGEQISNLKRGAEIVVCTPGRMIDLLAMNQGRITNLSRATFVVLDEADRMFDMGFEPQITRIVENVRPDRQTVMFSATFPSQVEMLARKVLRAPVEIVVGGNSVVASTIDQYVEVVEEDKKFLRLLDILAAWQGKGAILIFVERQNTADRILRDLLSTGHRCLVLHGGMDQADRDSAIVDFKNGAVDILVATSVAARGLDVKHLRVVINFDVPNHFEDYVHRVGRTGRAGNKGTAYTFITKEQDMYASEIVKAFELSAKRAAEDANPGKKKEELKLDEVAAAAVPGELRKLADEFANKKKLGLVKHGASSGYGGKGFKFTEAEDNANVALKKMQAEEYGVEVKTRNVQEEEEDEPIIKDIERDGPSGERRDAPPTAPAVPAAPAVQPDAVGGPTANAAAKGSAAGSGKAEELDMVQKAQQKAREIADALSRISKPMQAKGPQPGPAQPAAAAPAAGSMSTAEMSAAAKAAAQISQRLGRSVTGVPEEVEPEPEEAVMRKYTELEINDYPQNARWKVTRKNSLADIEEFTGCAVTVKGLHFPPGRNPASGERKLFLLIEGPDESSVKTARSEIKRRLDEAAMSRPEEKQSYAKYSVV